MDDQNKQKVSDKLVDLPKSSSSHAKDQIKMLYKIRGNDVIIFESRPYWQDTNIWTEMPIVKIKFLPDDKAWQLFWQRANGRWHKYPDFLQQII